MRAFFLLLFSTSLISSILAESPWALEFDPQYGLSVRYEDVPIIRRSTLAIVSPDWNPVLFHQAELEQEIEKIESNTGPAILVRCANEFFSVEYQIEALSDREFRLRMEGSLRKDLPARIEYAAGYLNANLISGVSFRGESKEGKTAGFVPMFPMSEDQNANDLLPGFEWLEFESRIGKIRMKIDAGGRRVAFFDAQRDPQPWAEAAPVFWLGLGSPAQMIEFGDPVTFEMVLTIEPGERQEAKSVEIKPSIYLESDVRSPKDREFRMIPTPKREEIGTDMFLFPSESDWTIQADNEEGLRLKDNLLSVLERFEFDDRNVHLEAGGRFFEIRFGQPEKHSFSSESDWFSNPEGYRLIADQGGVLIISSTAEGAFYGLQTFSQLLRPSPEGVRYVSAWIEDWPSMKFRGAHWFPSASGVFFHEKLIERIMGHFKMNRAVIQCEAAVWESHPEIAGPNSISKLDLRRLVELSRENFIEPIPLINVPGHAEWIFRNDQNLHLAEGPGTRYAYCVNHPGSFEFIRDILGEAVEVFEPRQFHLGHDEVTMHGNFPHPECELCREESATDLVMKHLQRLKEWLDVREIEMMVWGDMMLSRDEVPDTAAFAPSLEEAKLRRAKLPEDLIVADWHYYPGQDYPSLGYFHDEGVRTIASTWYVRENIHHFSQAALEQNSLGLLQTTWAGYFPDEEVLSNALHQFTAFVLAAEYAWSGNSLSPSELPFEAGAEFFNAYYRTSSKESPGTLVDLSEVAKTARKEWTGVKNEWNFEDLGSGRMRLGEVSFLVPENFLILGGSPAPESAVQEVSIEIGEKAKTIALLNSTLFNAPQKSIPVRMRILYSDGSKLSRDLIQGVETHHWKTLDSAQSAKVVWQKETSTGVPIAMRLTTLENPHPEKSIEKIVFEHVSAEQAWALVGLSLIKD